MGADLGEQKSGEGAFGRTCMIHKEYYCVIE